MSKSLLALLALVLFTAVTVAPAAAADSDLIISEVQFNSWCEATNNTSSVCATSGATVESQFEWVEISNQGSTAIDLTGWKICDASACDSLPGIVIGPGEYWLIGNFTQGLQSELTASGDTYIATRSLLLGTQTAPNPIGNGLSNTSDAVYLLNPAGLATDCISWSSTSSRTTCSNLTYVDGSSGDDTLLGFERDGQSITNVGGTWGYHGPNISGENQNSPYGPNNNPNGPTAVTLTTLSTRTTAHPWYGIGGAIVVALAVSTLFARRVRRA